MKRIIFYLFLICLFLNSCITPKVHNKLISDSEETKKKLQQKEKELLALNADFERKSSELINIKKKIDELKNDSIQNGKSLMLLQSKYDELSDTYDLLASKNSRYISEKAKETKRLLEQLEEAQAELFKKEDELNELSNSLLLKQNELQKTKNDLELRAVRVSELELIINRKDSIVTNLKQSISKALTGLDGQGLTIIQRNGKVYISLEEDLLFASGKAEVNSRGIIALNKLAVALSTQNSLQILVEGHTDSIPFSGKGIIKDNWDLSVMRATSVVKVLLKNPKLEPLQLTAAGRAEFMPIASNKTSSGRDANRRIEMIISPNLDDLFELLNE